MESLIYIANLLYLTSYLVRDILRLRLLTVVAALCLVAYFYCREEPMMTVVYWNLFFVTLNVVQILRLLLGRFGTAAACPRQDGLADTGPRKAARIIERGQSTFN